MVFVWDEKIYLKIMLCSWLPKEILYIIAAQEATNGSAFKVEGLKNLLFSSSFFSSILSQNIFYLFKDYHSGFFLNLLGYFWLIFTVLEPSKTFLEGFARFSCKIFEKFYILSVQRAMLLPVSVMFANTFGSLQTRIYWLVLFAVLA